MAIELSIYTILYFYQFLLVVVVFYALKETIYKRLYGIRFLRWVEIDTGRKGYTILNKSLNQCKVMGETRTVSMDSVIQGIAYFTSDNVQNLTLEDASWRWEFYCNKDEFKTVMNNTLLVAFLSVLKGNILNIIMIIAIIAAAVSGYNAYMLRGMGSDINFLSYQVEILNQTTSNIIHNSSSAIRIP